MGTIYWFDHRGTSGGPSGYPGDGANATYSLGTIYGGGDPGVGVYAHGWVASNTGNAANKTTYATNARFGGRNVASANVDSATYRINGLVVGHSYKLYLGLGGLDTTLNCGYTLYSDNRTTTITTVAGGSVTAGAIMDAGGNVRTDPTDWAANQVAYSFTATTTDIYLCKAASNNMYVCCVGLEDTTAASGPPKGTLGMMGMGL